MANKNFTNCNVVIFDDERNLLANERILNYDGREQFIEVPESPGLIIGNLCNVLILTTPSPYMYKGRIRKHINNIVITLFKENTVENRKDPRFKTDFPVIIEPLDGDDKGRHLHAPVEAKVINISSNGIRLHLVSKTALSIGNRVKVRFTTGEKYPVLIADVVNHTTSSADSFEYGCRLIGKEEK